MAVGSMNFNRSNSHMKESEPEPCPLEKTISDAQPEFKAATENKSKKFRLPGVKDFVLVASGLGLGLVANEVRKRTKETDEWLVDRPSGTATFIASFMILTSMFASSYNQLPFAMFSSTLIFCTSLNYWREPTDGFRRRMDITCVAVTWLLQLFLVMPMAPRPAQIAYFIISLIGIGSYFIGRHFSFTDEGEEPNHLIATVFHIILHLLANVGNVVLCT
eukprot:32564_1